MLVKSLDELQELKFSLWSRQLEDDSRISRFLGGLSRDEVDNFYETILLNPYIPVVPFYHQIVLLFSYGTVLYGGARGGGKTEASLMGALQYVEYPSWKVGIFRLTYPDLSVPGAIMDRALDWLQRPYLNGLGPYWDGKTKTFTFNSGAKIMFGHVQHEKDVQKYQGPEFHRLIFDEAVQFTESKITRIKAANRKQKTDPLPLSIWYTGNPGGLSHDYFKKQFIDGPGQFINSRYTDNPYLDHKEYEKIFSEIRDSDPILYRQWKWGDWEAVPEGKIFKREWFTQNTYVDIDEEIVISIRFWDLAATHEEDPTKQGGADWTVGILLLKGISGRVYLEDIVRFRLDPDEAEEKILKTSHNDATRYGRNKYKIRIEQEGGASAKYVINNFSKKLAGQNFDGSHIPRKNKIDRAKAFVSFIKHGNLKIHENNKWIQEFLNEISSFPTKGIHDDQVDSLTGGLNELLDIKEPLNINPHTRAMTQ
jgi:predicted phage terminase large subunit-like protein